MNQNEAWAYAIIDQLVENGINQFYIAPGYRSTSLILAVEKHPGASSTVFFDERALGFMALGFSKAANKPCAIITTSGTAVANLYPSVVEAQKSHTPLILLTADRPYEKQDCGQNQTIEQQSFFSPYTCYNLNLPAPDSSINLDYLASSISYALHSCKKHSAPIHINCPFRKPFYVESPRITPCSKSPSFSTGTHLPLSSDLEIIQNYCSEKTGVIILGELPLNTNLSSIFSLAEKLGWPIFADPLSKIHQHPERKNVISYFELILKSKKFFSAELILQFGNRFISTNLFEWIEKQDPIYIHISPYPSCYDPIRKIIHHIEADPFQTAKSLLPLVEPQPSSPLFAYLKMLDLEYGEIVSSYFKENQELTEIGMIYHFGNSLSDCVIFFANSMPIRNCLEFFHPNKALSIFTNRGVSGIDGNLSTTIGIQKASGLKTIGIIGDLATLHDINALAAANTPNLHFFIINNHGGGIFSHLPISEKKEVFERYYLTKHTLNFALIAKQFNLSYLNITSIDELKSLSFDTLPTFIEFTTCCEKDKTCHREIMNRISMELTYHES